MIPEKIQAQGLEHQRVADILCLANVNCTQILDAGARDGLLSRRLANNCKQVTALDLTKPDILHPNVCCVKGDIASIDYPDNTFDLVVCTEVLEHIPEESLSIACSELSRVSNRYVLIGVPYQQDIRVGRTTCEHCGFHNPPWGHVNSFDEERLLELFAPLKKKQTSFVGSNRDWTNGIATRLMDLAGNPFGTYDQQEPCVNCDRHIGQPARRTTMQRGLTKLAWLIQAWGAIAIKEQPNWIHILFEKQPDIVAKEPRKANRKNTPVSVYANGSKPESDWEEPTHTANH